MDTDTRIGVLLIKKLELEYKKAVVSINNPESPELAMIQADIDRLQATIDFRNAHAYDIKMKELEESLSQSKKTRKATEICDILAIDKNKFPEIHRFFSELPVNKQGKCVWSNAYGGITGLAYVLEQLFGKKKPIVRNVPQRWKSFAHLFADESGEEIRNAELSKRAEKLRGSTPERHAPSGASQIVERWRSQENPEKSP